MPACSRVSHSISLSIATLYVTLAYTVEARTSLHTIKVPTAALVTTRVDMLHVHKQSSSTRNRADTYSFGEVWSSPLARMCTAVRCSKVSRNEIMDLKPFIEIFAHMSYLETQRMRVSTNQPTNTTRKLIAQ